MLALNWTDIVLYGGLLVCGGFCLGMATALCLGRRRTEPGTLYGREWDQSRWRESGDTDAYFRGVRWLPTGEDDGS